MDLSPNFTKEEIKFILDVYSKSYGRFQKGCNIEISDEYKELYKLYSTKRINQLGNSSRASNKRLFLRHIWKSENKDIIKQAYEILYREYSKGFGIKRINSILNLGYTLTRSFLIFLGLELNEPNIENKSLNNFRKNKSKKEHASNSGWFNEEIRRNLKIKNSNGKGVQGHYYNRILNKWVWLRSSYEYIFAEYLTENKLKWDTEVKTYKLDDGTKYTPDFFIYDEYSNLNAIVEIKGYLTVNSYKVEKLKKVVNTQISLIQNINLYKTKNINYLKKWKEIRLLELPK
jgi:hypothetical protein